MTAASRHGRQMQEGIAATARIPAHCASIGGLRVVGAEALCPTWPQNPPFGPMPALRL